MKKRQFTATVYILNDHKTLLLYHQKLKKWLPPGGHLEANELPPECAIREAFEETGLKVTLLSDENVWVDKTWNSCSFERPYMCLLEEIPEKGDEPQHQHIDFIYVGVPSEKTCAIETDSLRWMTLDEVNALIVDEEIFQDTRIALQQIFMDFANKLSPSRQGYALT